MKSSINPIFNTAAHTFVALLFIQLLPTHAFAQWYGKLAYPHQSTFSTGGHLFSKTLMSNPGTWPSYSYGNNPFGYVMGGYWPTNSPGTPNFEIHYMDEYGLFGPGTYSNTYIAQDNVSCVGGLSQITDCGGIAVCGAYNVGNGEISALAGVYGRGVFFATMDINGVPISCYRWKLPVQAGYYPTKPYIFPSPSTQGDFYICGDFAEHSYVIRVSGTAGPTANSLWISWYDTPYSDLELKALVESPYNTSRLEVVGKLTDTSTNYSEAVFLELNAANGATVTYNTYSDGSLGDNWFTSIKPAASTAGGSNGFLIGGFSNSTVLGNNTFPQWMTKLDPSGTVIWSSLIEPIYSTNYNQQTTYEINDVVERYNPAMNSYENYGVGGSTIFNGTWQYDYLSVFKLNDVGVTGTLTPTEFRYMFQGGWGINSNCFITDNENSPGGGADDGIQTYGMFNPTGDYLLTKGYFNGVVGCSDSISDVLSVTAGPGYNRSPFIQLSMVTNNCPGNFLLNSTAATPNSTTVCSATTVGGGSNARTIPTSIEESSEGIEFSIFPNPTKGQIFIQRKGGSSALADAKISILNALGQTVYLRNAVELKCCDSESNRFDLNEIGLSPGLYIINIALNGLQVKTEKILLTDQ